MLRPLVSCCRRMLSCCLHTICAPCLLLRCGARTLRTRVPWRHRVFVHMSCLYLCTFFLILPMLCHDVMHSKYFIKNEEAKQHRKDILIDLNEARMETAEAFLREINKTQVHKLFTRNNNDVSPLDLAVSVVTVSRGRHQSVKEKYRTKYLTQVVATLLQQMQQAKQSGVNLSMHLEICNVDFDPVNYHEARAIAAYVPMIQRFNKTYLTLDHRLEKEKKDYVFCLQKAQRFNPRYTLLIEDDALPIDAFLTILEHTIRTHLDREYLRGEIWERSKNVAFVKLWHPERLQGYISLEVERIPEWISLSMFCASLSALCYHYFINKPSKNSGFHSTSIRNISIAFFIYFMLVFLMIDRSNIISIRNLFTPYFYSYVPAPECCTPAMLFPKEGAQTLISYLTSIECKKNFGKDIALWRFIVESHKPKWYAYMVQPNIVSHIGMHSALRNNLVDPFLM